MNASYVNSVGIVKKDIYIIKNDINETSTTNSIVANNVLY